MLASTWWHHKYSHRDLPEIFYNTTTTPHDDHPCNTDPTSVMANSRIGTASQSNLYKAFFNDATLSDLTIRMSDKSKVFVHRIVLCRRSEYFTKLLTGAFQV